MGTVRSMSEMAMLGQQCPAHRTRPGRIQAVWAPCLDKARLLLLDLRVILWALFVGGFRLFQSRQIGWTQPALNNRKSFWHANRNNLAALHFNPHLHWWIG